MELPKVIADSSSIILLQKVGLLTIFLNAYWVIIPGPVYDELTGGGKKGSAELHSLLANHVETPSDNAGVQGLGRGEGSVISLYFDGVGDFVLLDDKKAAKYCKSQAIPFINALLAARILCLAGAINDDDYRAAAELLIREGYYSDAIIEKAAAIRDDELQQFMPLKTYNDAAFL